MRETIANFTLNGYATLLPFAWIALAIAVFVLLPLAAFRKTRGAAGLGLVILSYLFAFTTWLLCCGVSFASFGWPGLIIGLFLAGVGVVGLAIIAAIFKLKMASLAVSILVMVVIAIGANICGAACVNSAVKNNND
jgi:hypothetical protein